MKTLTDRLSTAALVLLLASVPAFAQHTVVDQAPDVAVGVTVTPTPPIALDRLELPTLVDRFSYQRTIDVAPSEAWGGADLAKPLAAEQPRPASTTSAPDLRDSYSRLQKVLYHCSWPATLATGAADIATTHRNIEAGFVEANHFLVRKDGGFNYARKAALTVGSPLVNHHALWKRGHPWKAVGVNAFTTAVNGVAAAHNERLFRTVTPDGRPIVAAARFKVGLQF
jgi:hypothetical protein